MGVMKQNAGSAGGSAKVMGASPILLLVVVGMQELHFPKYETPTIGNPRI
jgi:hypothetical protein